MTGLLPSNKPLIDSKTILIFKVQLIMTFKCGYMTFITLKASRVKTKTKMDQMGT